MDVNVWKMLLDRPADVRVKVAIHFWRQPCLNTHFGRAKCRRFLCPSNNLFCWQKVSFLFPKVPAESAKAALLYADVCKVDVSVNNVCYIVSNRPAPELVGNSHYKVHFKAGRVKERDRFIGRDILPGKSPIECSCHHRVSTL